MKEHSINETITEGLMIEDAVQKRGKSRIPSKALDTVCCYQESTETESESMVQAADPGKIHMLRMQISTP
ncbi:hypothetical protein Tco_1304449 [Tanacetum coccineum]